MRFTTIFAFILGIFVLFVGAFTSAKDPHIYLNAHACLIVIGGTFSAAAISFGFTRLFNLSRVLTRRIFGGQKYYKPKELIEQIMQLADVYRSRPDQLRNELIQVTDPFLKEALELVLDGYYKDDDLIRVLSRRTLSVFQQYHEEAIKFRALAKFPPAFGLMGAVLGMIGVMTELGSADSVKAVGPSLALALVGTLYGVALANLVILPLTENLLDSAREIKSKNMMITEAIHLLLQKKNPIIMAEDLNSFLLAGDRLDWRRVHQRKKEAA